jgi:uncharacterized repeat protein (TIGR03843 family)
MVSDVLAHGSVEIQGRFAGSSNTTLLVTCSWGGVEVPAVYKPQRGERPLWDFASGLQRREMAAYVLSEELGWSLVPATVLRDDAPLGPGSIQHFVEDDGESHYFTLRDDPARRTELQAIATLDVVINNADRKSGHVIVSGGRVWAIDHGLCFHEQPKLRTVIWDFAGEEVPPQHLDDLRRLLAKGRLPSLEPLLEESEIDALLRRTSRLVKGGRLPEPVSRRDWPPYPWPLV